MTTLTREAIVKALHDKGAYCGVCDYETALDGTPGCSECREVLNGYADAILALASTVDRDTTARLCATLNLQGEWDPTVPPGGAVCPWCREPWESEPSCEHAQAVYGHDVRVGAHALREAADEHFRQAVTAGQGDPPAVAQWLRDRADRIEAGEVR